jgi:hypothetical protein
MSAGNQGNGNPAQYPVRAIDGNPLVVDQIAGIELLPAGRPGPKVALPVAIPAP